MGVPTSEVGYNSAMPRREDHEVHKDMRGHWGEKIVKINYLDIYCIELYPINHEIRTIQVGFPSLL